tara:strand:+ start:65 stop:667 length:603 start_codon:yes stop_codon:yes gene_type:complete
MESQQKVWDNIAPEWHEFKKSPSQSAQEFLKKQKGNALDLGSGSGRNLLGLKTKAKMHLVDFSKKMLELAEKRAKKEKIKIETKVSDSTKIPYEDNFFDAAICVAALHCIETPAKRRKTLKELHRVLKPKAQLEIEVWNKESERFKNKKKNSFIEWRDKGKRFYYLYTKNELKEELKKAGFKFLKQNPHRANIIFVVQKP